MKTIVFSDTHLGKYSKTADERLQRVIKKYDRVIIVGDFYDRWYISLKDFINSQYQNLFNLLKSKETVYIYMEITTA